MASQPGPLSQWPWHRLGNFKYVVLAPPLARSMYKFWAEDVEENQMDTVSLLIFPFLLLRLIYAQLWISICRFQTARSKHRILDKSIDFDQVDRERNWDDQIILTALIFYAANATMQRASYLPWWNTNGVVLALLLHSGPVEFLYYWFHRALHHHFLYSRYHSHHHASIVTEPITSVIHPFAEEMVYFLLFTIPLAGMISTGTASIAAVFGYIIYIDFMNYMGHCNIEMVPGWFFNLFPPLKYLMYTPSFHSLHHTKFRTNYSLFMPFYDYIYGTMDEPSDELYERALIQEVEGKPQVIHLTHLTNLQSIFHLRMGFASLASKPYAAKWYIWMLGECGCSWIIRLLHHTSMLVTWICSSAFIVERNRLNKLHMETWAIPKYNFQYKSASHRNTINGLIEKAILEAEKKGVKVLSLGLLNQGYELNEYGSLYLKKTPKLKMKIVDGTSLAVAMVLNNVPQESKEVMLIGNLTKMAYFVALTLCKKGLKVVVSQRDQYELLKLKLPSEICSQLLFSCSYTGEVWLVGDGVRDQEQKKAAKNAHFVPISQFPLKRVRKDCIYHSNPALVVPKTYENLHSCENWLPRRVMSAWRVAGIVHALEQWNEHECGDIMSNVDKVWHATLRHGFLPYNHM